MTRAARSMPKESEMDMAAPDPLQAVRQRIDAIDEELQKLLVGRSELVADLARIKDAEASGTAFRPDREAEMMRRLVQRHQGDLALTTVEHIWREIVSASTAMQAPFGVIVGPVGDPAAMRDLARFYFGFSVALEAAESAEAAIAHVAQSGQDLALIAADTPGPWWTRLAGDPAPKICARLPFIDLPERPADLPAYVVARTSAETLDPDIRVFAIKRMPGLEAGLSAFGGVVAGKADDDWLIELPVAATLEDVATAAGGGSMNAVEVGGFCQPIRFVAARIA